MRKNKFYVNLKPVKKYPRLPQGWRSLPAAGVRGTPPVAERLLLLIA
jgi:hypothetical protein